MTRIEFLSKLWKNYMLPILWVLMMAFATNFLFKALAMKGPERFALILLFIILLLMASASFIGSIGKSIKERVVRNIHPSHLKRLQLLAKLFSIIILLISGWYVLNFWTKEWPGFLITIGLLLTDRFLNPGQNQ